MRCFGRRQQRKYRTSCLVIAVMAGGLLWPSAVTAQMTHDHPNTACADAGLACATTATPTFAPDGSLWLTWAAAGRISVARSPDRGRTFGPSVAVNESPQRLDSGPDERPKIAVDTRGRVAVAYAIFKDNAFNGQVLYSRSDDGGKSFASPRAITSDRDSQRFEAIAFDPAGNLFAAWLDKRDRRPARAQGRDYIGAALAFAWSSDGGTNFGDTRIAKDNTCECCRLGVAFVGPGRPVVLFRNVFGGTVRDHAITTFDGPSTPGPIYRVSVDDWAIDVCPHHGPSLAVDPNGSYHATWFTNGSVRKGLFYAHSEDGGRTFSQPVPVGRRDRNPSRPFVIAAQGAVWLAWKEFDGEESTVNVMRSEDGGRNWSAPKPIAHTADASDHPQLVSNGHSVFLSWMTRADGYQFVSLENAP